MSSRDDSVVCWVEMERELDIMESRPRRHLANNIMREEVPNTLKEVEMQDIRMFPCSKTDASATVNAVLPVLLRAVGVQFPKSMNTCLFYTSKKMPRPPTFQLLEEWNLLPTGKMMFSVPSAGAKNIALSLIQAMTKTTPCIEFVFSLLETKASQLDELYWSKAKSVRIARFEEYLREIMKELQSINFSISDEDFKLAIVVYALGILKRWVHDTIPESVVEAEKEQGKKRKKRDERPFTQDHFIEKMKNCLFKGLSNPLHLQSAGVLQVSLRLLLSLVEAQLNYGKKGVPRDYESNLRSVRETITNFLLRRECDKVSPTDTLAALDAWRQLVRTLDMPGKMFSCFESSSALCNALRIYFEFSRASRVSDQWIQECERLFASSQQFPSQDDKAVIVHAYIDVLEHHWRSRHTHKAKLKEVLEKAIIMCPYEGSFIRRFIDIFSGGSRNLILRRFFDGIHAKDDPTRDMYHSLSCLYMEQRRAEMLLEGGAALHSNAVALITRREAEQRKDPALWRLAMAQSRTKRCFDEVISSICFNIYEGVDLIYS
ncbi:unnamed protein product [Heligmosomoides polygyrus]|uniref:Anaphase-promoting complex subunit 5 n=1 Tax=Heligmosomoides polygyrus TaxID=6339 RepID=A0A183GBS2_HELPZ|nr:unnamed protein product [Heligmosomoides polygyrus]